MTRKTYGTACAALTLSSAFWGGACLAVPSVIAPNGPPPETAPITERPADGTPALTLRAMNNTSARNQKALDSHALQSASKTDLRVALSPCLTVPQADSGYTTASAIAVTVKAGSDGATGAEQVLCSRVSDTQAELRALPTPSGMALACYWNANNQNKGNLAVYALGAWRWVGLGSPI